MRMIRHNRGSARPGALLVGLALGLSTVTGPAWATSSGSGPDRVVEGAKEAGRGVEETAKGIGQTVTEGAKDAGRKLEPTADNLHDKAKGFGEAIWDGMKSVGRTMHDFFTGKK